MVNLNLSNKIGISNKYLHKWYKRTHSTIKTLHSENMSLVTHHYNKFISIKIHRLTNNSNLISYNHYSTPIYLNPASMILFLVFRVPLPNQCSNSNFNFLPNFFKITYPSKDSQLNNFKPDKPHNPIQDNITISNSKTLWIIRCFYKHCYSSRIKPNSK